MKCINENSLLTWCARIDMSETAIERVNHLISGPLKWDRVVSSSLSENIAPLLYHSLKHFSGSGLVPDNVLRTLQQAYYENVVKNMHLFTELGRVLEEFRNNHVEVMVLKGAVLANTVYRDIGLRSMLDIDLLVKEKDLTRSKKIMSSLNYKMGLNESEEWYRRRHFHLPLFFNREKSIAVEVHWNIARKSFNVDIDRWWERAVRTELNNTVALIPSPEDMLLHLCLHLHNHMYEAQFLKRGLCDFAETLRYYEGTVNLDSFKREAGRCGLTKTAHAVLYLVNKFFALQGPASLPVSAGHPDMRFICILEDKLMKSSDLLGHFVCYYATDGMWNKAGALLRAVFPDHEVMGKYYSIPVTSKKLYFYYCIRPFELFFKYWRDARALLLKQRK